MISRIDDLILISYLDAGCIAEIFLSKKQGYEELFATKRISKQTIYQEPYLKNYIENEIIILKQINHPNIIKLYDIKVSNEYIYLVMEYANGGSLLNALNNYKFKNGKPFTEKIVQFLMKQILLGVDCLHKHKIIHRDLKLDNILLKYNSEEEARVGNIFLSQIKIIDFDISTRPGSYINDKMINPILCNNSAIMNNFFGEMIYDEKVDIFSLGLLCYEMLTGEKVYINGAYNIYIPQNISNSAKSFLFLMLQKKGNERLSVEDLLRHEFINNYNGFLNNRKELNYYPYTEKTVNKTKSFFQRKPNNLSELRLTMQPRYATPTVEIPQQIKIASPIKKSKFIPKFNTECKDKPRCKAKSKYDFSTVNSIHPKFVDKYIDESKTLDVDKPQQIRATISRVITQPLYKQYKIGNKISGNQLKIIANCCKKYYLQMKGREGTAMKASEELKQVLGGNWLIFISNLKCKQFDFNISSIQKGNFVIFSLDNKLFQICKY